MNLKGDQSTTRALNRRLVLNQIRQNGPMSRVAITAASGLSAAAVSFITQELIVEGLLVEDGALPTQGGRRPTSLRLAYESRLSLGFKVMADRVLAVLTDLSTTALADGEAELPDQRPESVAKTIVRLAQTVLDEASVDSSRLIGMGVALAGVIDTEAGVCRALHRFGWRDVHIAELLGQRVAVPVWIDNDANALAIAQHLFGLGRQAANLAAIAVGRGVGAGLVIRGRLYRGHNWGAGEIGHDLSEPGDRLCECGRRGCLETYCSEPGMLRSWRESGAVAERAEDLAQAARDGDPAALKVLEEAGARLGRHVAALANLFDPELIVIGGEAVRFGSYLFDPMKKRVAELSFGPAPEIAIDWQDNAWARGAAALAIQNFFNFEATSGYRSPKLTSEAPRWRREISVG